MDIWLNVAGLLMNIAGLWIAIHQTIKARSAAVAARDASVAALRHVKTIQGVVSIQQVCWHCKELLDSMRDKQLRPAANTTVNLRECMSRFSATDMARAVVEKTRWKDCEDLVEGIQQKIELASMTDRISKDQRLGIVTEVARLHSWLTSIASETENYGASNVHTH